MSRGGVASDFDSVDRTTLAECMGVFLNRQSASLGTIAGKSGKSGQRGSHIERDIFCALADLHDSPTDQRQSEACIARKVGPSARL